MRANFAAAALFLIGSAIQAQSPNLPPASATELRYYDRWPGAWHRVDDDRVDSLPTFVVRRGPGNAFLKDWYLEIDGARQRSFAVRSWDAATRTWRLVWVADPDHFQIWDGLRLADGWYIIRKFSLIVPQDLACDRGATAYSKRCHVRTDPVPDDELAVACR
jgi:hypothetical protein